MSITNQGSGTNVHEIAAGIFRISTPVTGLPGGFTFNQILIVDDEPLLFHTGPRSMFALVREAVGHVLGSAEKLRWIAFSHIESDECGSMNEWLAVAKKADVIMGKVAGMTSADLSDRPPRVLGDGEELSLGKKRVRWLDAPHLPHNWECGYMFEPTTRTLLCGDLFTHMGDKLPPVTESEILSPAEVARKAMPGSVAVDKSARAILEKLAATEPAALALMHGSSYRGNGAKLLLGLADAMGV
ncbi:MAG: MBL fold metallo-hydrolase [Polyangiaceae bacterium]